jgi:hypothetical protein
MPEFLPHGILLCNLWNKIIRVQVVRVKNEKSDKNDRQESTSEKQKKLKNIVKERILFFSFLFLLL